MIAGLSNRRREDGFTFAEVLAAMVFLAILVPALVEGITIANRASVMAERSSIASELAENKLSELKLDDAWTTATNRGDFGQDFTGYRWEMSQETWEMDNMTKLTVTVYFTVQGRERSFQLSKLVNPSSSTTQSQSS